MPAKELLVIQQVDGDGRIGEASLQNRHAMVASRHGDRQRQPCRFKRPAGDINGAIAGQKEAYLVPQSRQFFGQTPQDVGHTTFFGKRNRLRTNHENIEACAIHDTALVEMPKRYPQHCSLLFYHAGQSGVVSRRNISRPYVRYNEAFGEK